MAGNEHDALVVADVDGSVMPMLGNTTVSSSGISRSTGLALLGAWDLGEVGEESKPSVYAPYELTNV